MSRFLSIIVILAVVAAASAEQCHPNCKWQCDDPSCPAVCHPVCESPKCDMQCEETPCAKCVVHCQRPVCTIRCPKDLCEKEGCPKCEAVCQPPLCHTTCTAPEPKCQPVCEELKCGNKCLKPTNCAKPKCELQCEKSACELAESQCCTCNHDNVVVAIKAANNSTQTAYGGTATKSSLLEVLDTMTHYRQQGKEQCCPCAQN